MRSLFLGALTSAVVIMGSACGQVPPETARGTEPAPLPDVAEIVCDESGTRVVTPAVRPREDGVHFEIRNETGADLAFKVDDPSGGGAGRDAPPGSASHVLDLHPGRVAVACFDGLLDDPSEIPGEPLEVVDEHGLWISTALACTPQASASIDYIAGARGRPNPLNAVREYAGTTLRPADALEPAGYPEAETRLVRQVRDGETVALFQLFGDGAGGWLLGSATTCAEPGP